MTALTMGSVTAIGIGIGAALASSMGPIAYVLGLTAAMGILLVAHEARRRGA